MASAKPVRVVGVDALVVSSVAPALMPVPSDGAKRLAIFAPGTVFLNPAARMLPDAARETLRLQSGLQLRDVKVGGTVSAGGGALAVMDIGAAQDLFDRQGQLSRIDVRLHAGVDHAAFLRSLHLPAGIVATEPGDAAQRVNNLSRAYRVNLTVLALVALFTGAFLVYSVLSLSVARRSQQLALLGVLGLTARQRLGLVLIESMVLGLAGSLAGIALGTALADVGLQMLGGDLGGGYFTGVAPQLQWNGTAAVVYALLGMLAAGAGGWLPARAAQQLPLAQALKGLGSGPAARRASDPEPAGDRRRRLAGAVAASRRDSVRRLLLGRPAAGGRHHRIAVGRRAAVRPAGAGAGQPLAPTARGGARAPRARERRGRGQRRGRVAKSRRGADGDGGELSRFGRALAGRGVAGGPVPAHRVFGGGRRYRLVLTRVRAERGRRERRAARHGPARPLAAARPGHAGGRVARARRSTTRRRSLPLVGSVAAAPAGQIPIYVSEAMVDLYGARPGTAFAPLSAAFASPAGSTATFFVAGVWRDYVRQSGAIAMDRRDYERLTGDTRANDLQLWLAPGADAAQVQQAIRELAQREAGTAGVIEFASAQELRAISLRIFDRSFAVTYWLQAVAIGIGLFGVAASFSAQVLARRKEFGLLAHLGLTRRQILAVVAAEGAAWTAIGSVAGLALGLAVSVVLVHVVNPQSFHWTMDLLVPWVRLLALCAAVVIAGTFTAWLAGRAAAGRDAVLAVKEDW